jgi:hypothetical protein
MSWSTVTWLVSWLPDSLLMWIFYGCFFLGIALILASWFVSFIPIINRYRFPTQVAGILVYGLGAFLIGGLGVELGWRERVAELEKKVAEAEVKSQQVNTVIQTKIVEKVRVVKEKGQQQIEYIDRVVKGDTTEITKDMSEEERQKFLVKQKELEDSIKNFSVPQIIVEELNKAAESK